MAWRRSDHTNNIKQQQYVYQNKYKLHDISPEAPPHSSLEDKAPWSHLVRSMRDDGEGFIARNSNVRLVEAEDTQVVLFIAIEMSVLYRPGCRWKYRTEED